VTSQDVARRAGVSRTTVSFVLNNAPGFQISAETRKRVIEAASELGYVPDAAAQALASGRSMTIGLLLARRSRLIAADMYLLQMMETLLQELSYSGMRLLLEVAEDYENSESYLKLVRSNSIDGVLYSGPRLNDDALRVMVDQGVPTVLMGALPNSSYYCVDIDNYASACQAVAHLVGLGHQRIACITNAPTTYAASRERLKGYQDSLERAGLTSDLSLVRYGGFSSDSGYEQMKDLLQSEKPFSAAFIASDVVAFGAMKAIKEAGRRIPEDIALVGFDDVPLASFLDPGLTSIHLPVADLAHRASQMLIQLVHGKTPAECHVILDTHLTVRESCGALRK
jgi:LacI family transcriptional regulator